MSQPTDKQPQGDFYAPFNRYKQPGDKQPMFKGGLAKPGEEAKQPIALWAFQYDRVDKTTGEVIKSVGYSGGFDGVPANIPAQDQINAYLDSAAAGTEVTVNNLTLRPGQVLLFVNGFKAEAPEKDRPDLWGWVNPTDGTPPFMSNVWIKKFEDSGRPYLSGKTQFPLPGKSLREQQDAPAEVVLAAGETPKGRRKAKSADVPFPVVPPASTDRDR